MIERKQATKLFVKFRIFSVAAMLIVCGFVLLGFVNVGKRVTSIDLNGIFATTNIYEHDYGHQVKAGDDPSQNILGYYVFKTHRGTIGASCILRDLDRSLKRGSRLMGATSAPLGDESFFQYELSGDDRLELAYRRFNVLVYFKDEPLREYRDGRPVLTVDTDKKELEETARILDKAILEQDPNVTVQNVRLYQVIDFQIKSIVKGIYFRIYLFFHPDFHF